MRFHDPKLRNMAHTTCIISLRMLSLLPKDLFYLYKKYKFFFIMFRSNLNFMNNLSECYIDMLNSSRDILRGTYFITKTRPCNIQRFLKL